MFWDFSLLQRLLRTIQRICIRFRQRQGKSTSATGFLAWVVETTFMNLYKSCNRLIMIADSDKPQWTSVGHTLLWHQEGYFGNKVSWFNVVSLMYYRSNMYHQELKLILLLQVLMFNTLISSGVTPQGAPKMTRKERKKASIARQWWLPAWSSLLWAGGCIS